MDNTCDRVTGLRLELTTTVPIPTPTLWALVTDVPAIGRWSPECIGARWLDGATAAAPGARFAAQNLFPDGVTRDVEGVVTASDADRLVFAWTMVDDDGADGSRWRYVLRPAGAGTDVQHSFEHGPGRTGLRWLAEQDPSFVAVRLGELAGNMSATLVAMERHVLEAAA